MSRNPIYHSVTIWIFTTLGSRESSATSSSLGSSVLFRVKSMFVDSTENESMYTDLSINVMRYIVLGSSSWIFESIRYVYIFLAAILRLNGWVVGRFTIRNFTYWFALNSRLMVLFCLYVIPVFSEPWILRVFLRDCQRRPFALATISRYWAISWVKARSVIYCLFYLY